MQLRLECFRCKHEWLRRNLDKLPAHCPSCNSPYWNKPRRAKLRNPVEGVMSKRKIKP